MAQIVTEAGCQTHLVRTRILPAAMKHTEQVANSISSGKRASPKMSFRLQQEHLIDINNHIEKLLEHTEALEKILAQQKESKAPTESQLAEFYPKITQLMGRIRLHCDTLEKRVDTELWQLPRYCEILCF